MFNFLMQDGALTVREKELIALGIAVAETCKPCLRVHIDKCIEAGVTDDEIIEAAGVAVMMCGGPACMQINEIVSILKRYKGKKNNGTES
jgi:AhpD family alkylhydroperoxidase